MTGGEERREKINNFVAGNFENIVLEKFYEHFVNHNYCRSCRFIFHNRLFLFKTDYERQMYKN